MKNKKGIILGIIIGIIMMSGVGVVAAIFNAEDIKFTPNDSSWEVTNVKEAMDSLYENTSTKSNVVSLGTLNCPANDGYSTSKSAICNISSLYDNYQNITMSNIIVQLKYFYLIGDGTLEQNNMSYSYDPASGIITIRGFAKGIYGAGPITADVYIVE